MRAAGRRLRRAALPIAQASIAAGLAWLVATELIGHDRPFFAPIAALISLGVSHNQRLRRAAELMVGVAVGIAVAELLVGVIGSGTWQIALVVALAMALAVLLDGGPVITIQAGASAVLVAALLPSGGVSRAVDALVGGAIGLGVAAVLPADPLTGARRQLRALLAELVDGLRSLAAALAGRDEAAVLAALSRARETQPTVNELRSALLAGEEIATFAPLRRRNRARLQRIDVAGVRADYALRNLRVLARRALAALREGEQLSTALPQRLEELAGAVELLRDELDRGEDPDRARAALLGSAAGCGPELLEGTGFSGRVVVAQLRSVVIDLLQATGTPRVDAAAALPPPPPTS
ncbi:MAG: aromatic acid exporter family protein [Pseudonocardiaceae bacterium]|nr:aromatic acid exporter family protein [Pseudonocardiaceae bacterium]